MDAASILKLLEEAVHKKQQIKISLRAAEEALTEDITRAEIETAPSTSLAHLDGTRQLYVE